ncbi:hypothetical protein ACIA5D_36680 [Actinoplanes sp. NPDC051513]|uniref:hypothetical protein n=1 Tax=Actinoplanes sp. NPDC051513 TaxID=3363908 RepID=UPI0037B203E8
MTNVAATDRTRPADWPYTEQEMRQVRDAVQREAYPPAGRTGVGSVLRRRLG